MNMRIWWMDVVLKKEVIHVLIKPGPYRCNLGVKLVGSSDYRRNISWRTV